MKKEIVLSSGLLSKTNLKDFENLYEECMEGDKYLNIFRTETQMIASVLNDADHPTKASKYWQAVLEQNVMFNELESLGIEYRRNEIHIKRLQKRIDNCKDELDLEELKLDMEILINKKINYERVAKDRIREIKLWSKIKKELNDGTFDTKDPNDYQKKSLYLQLLHRAHGLSANSPNQEVINVYGPLLTMKRLQEENKLPQVKTEDIHYSYIPIASGDFAAQADKVKEFARLKIN